MAYFEGIEMTGGYGNGPDIISSCSVSVNTVSYTHLTLPTRLMV